MQRVQKLPYFHPYIQGNRTFILRNPVPLVEYLIRSTDQWRRSRRSATAGDEDRRPAAPEDAKAVGRGSTARGGHGRALGRRRRAVEVRGRRFQPEIGHHGVSRPRPPGRRATPPRGRRGRAGRGQGAAEGGREAVDPCGRLLEPVCGATMATWRVYSFADPALFPVAVFMAVLNL